MKRLIFALLGAVALAGCAHTSRPEPIIQTVTVNVPVAVPCDPKLPRAPTYPDTNEALRGAPDIFERVKLLLAGRELRIARGHEQDAAIEGCLTKLPRRD